MLRTHPLTLILCGVIVVYGEAGASSTCEFEAVDATSLSREQLAKRLVSSEIPLVVQNAMSSWSATREWNTMGAFVGKHGAHPVRITMGVPEKFGGVRHEGAPFVEDTLIGYFVGLQNKTYPEGAYVFDDVRHTALEEAARTGWLSWPALLLVALGCRRTVSWLSISFRLRCPIAFVSPFSRMTSVC